MGRLNNSKVALRYGRRQPRAAEGKKRGRGRWVAEKGLPGLSLSRNINGGNRRPINKRILATLPTPRKGKPLPSGPVGVGWQSGCAVPQSIIGRSAGIYWRGAYPSGRGLTFLYSRAAETMSSQKLSFRFRCVAFSKTERMYMYTTVNRIGSGTYHGGKQHPGALLSENLWGDRWGKGKGESGTRGARDFSYTGRLEDAFSEVVQAQKEG